jgi:hypothetical protein
MTTVARTTGATIVTLLGTIGSAANAIAKTVDSATSGIDMLDAYVQRAKKLQLQQHAIEDADWLQNLKEDAALIQVKRSKSLASQLNNSERVELNLHIARYDALFVTETQP